MPKKLFVSSVLLDTFYEHTILPKYNSPAPSNGAYGWMKSGVEIALREPVTIEQNVGLYGGSYVGLIGGIRSSGFASIGAFSYTFSSLPEGMRVGRYCSISSGLRILDSSHPLETISTSALTFRPNNHLFRGYRTDELSDFSREFRPAPSTLPVIGHDVWLGADVTLAPGVRIGTGAVVAAKSVVTKDVAPYMIVGGNPARQIRSRFSDEVSQALLESMWWKYDPRDVFAQAPTDAVLLADRIRDGGLREFVPWSITLGAADRIGSDQSSASSQPNS